MKAPIENFVCVEKIIHWTVWLGRMKENLDIFSVWLICYIHIQDLGIFYIFRYFQYTSDIFDIFNIFDIFYVFDIYDIFENIGSISYTLKISKISEAYRNFGKYRKFPDPG